MNLTEIHRHNRNYKIIFVYKFLKKTCAEERLESCRFEAKSLEPFKCLCKFVCQGMDRFCVMQKSCVFPLEVNRNTLRFFFSFAHFKSVDKMAHRRVLDLKTREVFIKLIKKEIAEKCGIEILMFPVYCF